MLTWIGECFLGDHDMRTAVETASPSLARYLNEVGHSGAVTEDKRLRRAALSLMRYLLRAQGRATPFGLFAGVAPLDLTASTGVSWSAPHQEIAQPDPRWLAAHACAGRAPKAPVSVVAASTARVQGDLLVLPSVPHRDDPRLAATVSVRHTRAVSLALEHARTPIPLTELHAVLERDFPTAGSDTVTSLVAHLVDHRFLIGSDRPPVWHPRPLAHLATHHPDLGMASRLLERHDHPDTSASERPILRAQVSEHLRSTGLDADPHVAVDTRLRVRSGVHHDVAGEAARAVGVAARLAPHPSGPPAWVDYHRRCLDTYGQGSIVDLLTLTGPTGLGWPASFTGSRLPMPVSDTDTTRVQELVAAAQTTALHGWMELDLDSEPWVHLSSRVPDRVPTHVEVRAHLLADSASAVDDGDYRLWVTGLSKGVGALTGRFAYLDGMMPAGPVNEHLPTLTEDALPVQVLAPPLAYSAAHVARAPVMASHVLTIDTHPPGLPGVEVIDPRQVGVRIDPDHLRLVHLPAGRILEPFHPSALDTRHYTHPLARFVTELPQARTGLYLTPHRWPRATAHAPFLPRLRTGRVILAPAQWRLTQADRHTARTRTHLPLPRRILLTEGERHLPLDLDLRAHRSMLRDHLERHDTALLTEAPDPALFAWCDGHAHELVLPVGTTVPPVPPPSPVVTMNRHTESTGGDAWLSAHLYTDSSLFLQVLRALPDLCVLLDAPIRAWFVRYRDHEGPHLRLRLKASAPAGALESSLGRWASELQTAGVLHTLATRAYRPEYARYGPGPTMDAAETVFVHDSRSALAQLGTTNESPGSSRALSALSLLWIGQAMGASTTRLTELLPRSTRPVDREALNLARHLYTHPDELPPNVIVEWERRDRSLAAYRRHLNHPRRVLPSLWHMHHNRVHGPDREDEHHLLALTRGLALSLLHHPRSTHVLT
ncbi:lantibiotic dehydratase [Nocardiopsis alba]|uniref:lantibiotic dehydratase n=1 Tax=Nocardiopsis alba TaxID=53437 RepID=UPI0036712FEC